MGVTKQITDAVLDRLKTMFPAMAVEYFPDRPETYNLLHPVGALLISYGGGKFSPPEDTFYAVQHRGVKVVVNSLLRQLNGSTGIMEQLDMLRLALAGFRPPHCMRGLYVTDEHYLGQADGVWQYQTDFLTATMQVEDAEVTGPLLTQVVYEEVP